MKTNFENPWADTAIPVCLKEWLDCLEHQEQRQHYIRHAAEKLVDCYILPQPSGWHSMGMRYGNDGPEYFSPQCNPAMAQHIINRGRS